MSVDRKDYSEELLGKMRGRLALATCGQRSSVDARAVRHLRERTKELTCLYRVSRVLEDWGRDCRLVLADVAELLPGSWQYPEIAHARITWAGVTVESAGFQEGDWRQSASLELDGKRAGAVEVFYCEEVEAADEGPFLAEERLLIDAIAQNTERFLARRETLHLLRERVKELGCLYGISEIVNEHGADIASILQSVADLLPGSWQFPDHASARITLDDQEYATAGFADSLWSQVASIRIGEEDVGAVEVAYGEQMAEADEGPFLREERLLLNAVAERLGKVIRRIRVEQQLKTERLSLHNLNIAMKEVLGKVQEEKRDITEQIQGNVDRVVMPILRAYEEAVSTEHAVYVSLIRKNLEEIMVPFEDRLSKRCSSLSPTEIQVCNMVKNGLSTKDIARLRRISTDTVSRHREHIRRKLGIANTDANLATFLASFWDADG